MNIRSIENQKGLLMQKVVTNLWFNGQVQEALDFYGSIFDDFEVKSISHYGDAGPGKKGEVLVATFALFGQDFTIINGGPEFPLSPAVSLLVNCEGQAEVDELWEKLVEGGGQHSQCGWLTDPFGVSWQIVPTALEKLMTIGDEEQTNRVMQAMLSMQKLVISDLEKAFHGELA